MPAGNVYLVPVPIGNLGDITLRALDTLRSVALIACEDTRKTRFLLSQYEIKPPRLLSLHKYNEKQRLTEILALLQEGGDLAVVTAAGSPGISDPAQYLIGACLSAGIRIVPLPGATALLPAVIGSGLDCSQFQFLGFLPLRLKQRQARLEQLREYHGTSIVYEAPHRLRKTLEDILTVCGDRQICLARELTKLHEEFVRGRLRDLLEDYNVTEKGEFVIVLEGLTPVAEDASGDISAFLDAAIKSKTSLREQAAEISRLFGLSRNKAYQMVLEHRAGKS